MLGFQPTLVQKGSSICLCARLSGPSSSWDVRQHYRLRLVLVVLTVFPELSVSGPRGQWRIEVGNVQPAHGVHVV